MRKPAVQMAGTIRRNRAALLRTTALQATATIVLTFPAAAQPAVTARPQGGTVVAGSASIATTPTATNINQTSSRAAVNWTSFDVGSGQSVNFNQPSAASVTLNRVTGPDPSAIAGQIKANGQIVITNPSGVIFYNGSQVNAQSVVVSAAGITNGNFMAGRMVFDQAPKPNALIDNRGAITVAQAGLAALVAPAVKNSGVINAKLGQVILAGAQTHTLDMYGDGLVSIDVTGSVTQAPAPGGKTVTALVTNAGTIQADGGVVQLTAKAADGVVQTLVNASGKIQANAAAGQAGRIEITGTGGSVVVAGRIAADGAMGGDIVLHGDAATVVAGTAKITASGRNGGGTVAVGTSLARTMTSAVTTIASGARIAANATKAGNGGHVTVLSTQSTDIAGTITAKGGAQGGDGGTVEMSGASGFLLTGTADVSAPHGALGTILLDPANLTIIANGGTNTITPSGTAPNIAYASPPTNASVTEATIEGLTGNVDLQATNTLTVNAPLSMGAKNLTLEAGNTLTVSAASTIQTSGLLTLSAGTMTGAGYTGALTIAGSAISTGGLVLNAGAGGISLTGVANTTTLSVTTTGPLTEAGTGQLIATDVFGTAASVSLPSRTNQVTALGGVFTTSTGGFSLVDSVALTVGSQNLSSLSVPSGQTISLTADSLTILAGRPFTLSAPSGTIAIAPFTAGNPVELTSSTKTAGALSLTTTDLTYMTAATLQLGPTIGAAPSTVTLGKAGETINLNTSGGFTTLAVYGGAVMQGAALSVPTLTGVAGTVSLPGANVISTLGSFQTGGAFTLTNTALLNITGPVASATGAVAIQGTSLTVAGSVTAPTITLGATTGALTLNAGIINASGTLTLNAIGAVSQTGGLISAGTLAGSAGSYVLTQSGNVIPQLGALSATGALQLIDATTAAGLTVVGPVTAASTAITLAAGGLSVTGSLDVSNLALTVPGAVTASSTATFEVDGALTGSAGSVTFTYPVAVNSIGSFATTTGFTLADSHGLTVTGPLTDPTGVALSATGLLTLSGSITAPTIQASTADQTIGGVTFQGSIHQTAGNLTATNLISLVASGQLTQDGGAVNAGGGSVTLVSGGPMSLAGTVTGGAVSLAATTKITPGGTRPGTITQTAGIITATTLSGSASSTVSLASASNAITTLGGFNSTGGFALSDSASLGIVGPLSDTVSVSLTTAALSLAGSVSAPTLSIAASGAVSQVNGSVTATNLSGSAAGFALGLLNNKVATLGNFASTGDFALTDAVPLTVAGAVSAGTAHTLTLVNDTLTFGASGTLAAPGGTVALQQYTAASGFTLAGTGLASNPPITAQTLAVGLPNGGPVTIAGGFNLTTVSVLDLLSGGAINETGTGAVSVGTLAGTGASATLNGANQIGTLSAFTTTGAFSLTDGQSLTVSGPLSAATASLQVTGNLMLAGDIAAANGLSLQASGAITQTAGGITTGTLSGNSASAAIGSTSNAIAAIGYFGTTAGFTLSDGQSLNVVSLFDSNTATLNVNGDLLISGGVSAPAVNLMASGAITQTGGAGISATTLSVSATSAQLVGGNTVNSLGAVSTSTGFTLYDSASLAVPGPVTDGASIVLQSAGILTLSGAISAPSVTLVSVQPQIAFTPGYAGPTPVSPPAQSSTGISQTGGSITAGTLTGSSVGPVSLGSAANAISTLGSFSSVGGFALTTPTALSVTGPVTDTASIAFTTGPLTLAGTITAPALSITANGAVAQTGGTLQIGTLTGSAAGAAFGQPGNSVGTLSNFASSADFLLSDATALSVAGAVSAGTGNTLTLMTDAPTFASSASLSAPSGTVALQEYTPGNGLTLASIGSLTNNAPITAATLAVGSLTGGPITITGTLNLGNVSTLSLLSAGAISEGQSGVIIVNTVQASGASVNLTGSGNNQIATLGSSTVAGEFDFYTTSPLTVSGPVSADTLYIGSGNGLTVAASLTAPTQLDLESDGAIIQTAGAIVTGALTGFSNSLSLPQAGNAITTLSYLSTGTATITNSTGLTVVGYNNTGDATINLASGGLTIMDTLNTYGTLTLNVPGAVSTGPNGFLSATSLTGSAGSVNLGSTAITNVLNFASAGDFTLVSQGPLTLAGNITASSIEISTIAGVTGGEGAYYTGGEGGYYTGGEGGFPAPITQTGGSITAGSITIAAFDSFTQLAGSINATGNVSISSNGPMTLAGTIAGSVVRLITLDQAGQVYDYDCYCYQGSGTIAPGTITQTGGGINAGTLTGSASQTVSLVSSGNTVATLGAFSSVGGFALTNPGALAVMGPVTDTASITLATGPLALAGLVSAPTVAITANGAITQPAGSVQAGTLSGSASGNASFTQGGNSVAALAGFASSGDFALTDSAPVTIVGAASAGTGHTLTLIADAPTFASSGSLAAPGGTVALQEFTPGNGVTLAGGSSTPAVTANTLAIGTAAGGPVTITGAFNLSTISVLDLLSGGAISETGAGALQTAAFSGSGASASLTGPNQIATLGAFTTPGAFSLTDQQALVLTGNLSASALTLISAGSITQSAGFITAGSLSGRAASAAFGNAANNIAAVGPFVTTGDFTLRDGTSLTVTGPVDPNTVTLNVNGALTLSSAVAGGTVNLIATGAITETAGGSIAASALTGSSGGAVSLAASGNAISSLGAFTATGAFNLADSSLTVTGPLSAPSATLTATGALVLAGTIAAPTSLTLNASGGVTQTSGTLTTASLAGSVTSATLGGANAIGALAGFSGSSGLTLNDTQALTVTGPVAAGALALTAPNVTLAGTVTAGSFAVTTPGSLTQTSGTATIATLGTVTAGTAINLADSAALTVNGTLSAPSLTLSAAGSLTVNGGTIATANGVLQVAGGGAGSFVQTGTTSVLPLGGGTAALRIALPASGGSVTLAGLQAPSDSLVLALGTGTATGALTANSLLVTGAGGSANLTGTVAGQTGFTAAQISQISPAFSQLYQLNACAIASVSCSPVTVIPPTQPVQPIQPTMPIQSTGLTTQDAIAAQSFLITPIVVPQSFLRPDILTLDALDLSVTRDRDDPTLLLPNISDRDY